MPGRPILRLRLAMQGMSPLKNKGVTKLGPKVWFRQSNFKEPPQTEPSHKISVI
jgi:hypothetical protein